MVLATAFLGLTLVRRLTIDHRIGPKPIRILTCLYLSKLAMLFSKSKSILWMTAVLLLATSRPLFLYKDKSEGVSRMKAWQGYVHVAVIAFSTWLCRETIFEALQWWNGRPPSDGLLVGSLSFCGWGCLHPNSFPPLLSCPAGYEIPCLGTVDGLLFVLMQPPIPLSLTFHSDWIKAAIMSIIPIKYIVELRTFYAIGVGTILGIYICPE